MEIDKDSLFQVPALSLFSGLIFTLSGSFALPREHLRTLIEKHKGEVITNVTSRVCFILIFRNTLKIR